MLLWRLGACDIAEDATAEKIVNGIYKYYVGNNTDKSVIDKIKTDLINYGFKDAFVVAFYNGKRISTKDALNLQKQNN